MLFRRRAVCVLLAMFVAPRLAAGGDDVIPIVQLTAQPARFLSHDNCVGNLMLRELQRQAVLIAAREELGLATRDMVLREPFAPEQRGRVSTVLFESRIWRADKAQICLSRFGGTPPVDPYLMADVQVDRKENSRPCWRDFPISKDPLVDYPEFVARCEAASRGAYLEALRSEDVIGTGAAKPTVWAPSGAADDRAIRLLRQFNVVSQYLAVRLLHAQIRDHGATVDRMDALVRGYSNLVQLTENQWSQANKVFAARAMLYAQRLVVHEHGSPASLFTRGYAFAMASLHGAALVDLDAADQTTGPDSRPGWEPVVRGFCRFDMAALDEAINAGPTGWRDRELAMFLSALVSFDEYPKYLQQESVARALEENPAAYVLRTYASEMLDETPTPEPSPFQPAETNVNATTNHILNQLPILTVAALRGADLPVAVKTAAANLSPGDESFQPLAALRDSLNAAASTLPGDRNEPSLGALAGLIEEQDFAGVSRQAMDFRSSGNGLLAVQVFAKKADPILLGHPWGPYVEALGIDSSTEADRLNKTLDKVIVREPDGWVSEAIRELGLPDAEQQILNTRWQVPAYQLMDNIADDFNDDMAAAKCKGLGLENYLWRLRKTSPHCASIMGSWLKSMPATRIASDKPLYEHAMAQVQAEFADRSSVVTAAVDWANRRADFCRSLALLRHLDQVDSTDQICGQLAQICWRLGYRDSACAYLQRGMKIGTDAGQTDNLRQQLCTFLIEQRKYDQALACVQSGTDAPTPRVWQLMARCYEHMGRLGDAADCLSQQATGDPLSIEQYYMWAMRVGRKDVDDIGHKAVAAFAAPNDDFNRTSLMLLAQDLDRQAFDLMLKHLGEGSDAMQVGQAMTLALKLKDSTQAAELLKKIPDHADDAGNNEPDFGEAMRALAGAKKVEAGTRAFDDWVARQLDTEDAVDWYSLAGRYLVAAGHIDEGRHYLDLALAQTPRERESYFLAWRERQRIGDQKPKLPADPAR